MFKDGGILPVFRNHFNSNINLIIVPLDLVPFAGIAGHIGKIALPRVGITVEFVYQGNVHQLGELSIKAV